MRKCDDFDIFDITYGVKDIFNKTLPDPELLDYYNRLARREIFINTEIDDTCVDYAKTIMEWNFEDINTPAEERMPIKIYLNSPGGGVSQAYSLIDAMLLSQTPVITIGMGMIYSAASMIFIAGHKRYCLPHATYMIHDGYTRQNNSTAKALDDLEFTKKNEEETKRYYIERTKISPELYDSKYRVDWYMTAKEMVELGIADEIVTDFTKM